MNKPFIVVLILLTSMLTACSNPSITETVTQTQTLTVAVPTTTTVTITPSTTIPTIKTLTYINNDFRYSLDYPQTFYILIEDSPLFPNKDTYVSLYRGFGTNNPMSCNISVFPEPKAITDMIERDYSYYEILEYDGVLILDKGTDYYSLLTSKEGTLYYKSVKVYSKFNGFYTIEMHCRAELYFENMQLPQELQIILDSFTFIE